MSREAMQAALYVIDNMLDFASDFEPEDVADMEQAVAALRAALEARPVGGEQRVVWPDPLQHAPSIRAVLEAPEAPAVIDRADEWTEQIAAAHPTRTKAFAEYETALRMVGNRHSKAALVELVCWLLQRNKQPEAQPVAWLYHDAPTLRDMLANVRECPAANEVFMSLERLAYRNETPLYAHPPAARAPLTDKQIAKALAGAGLVPEDYRDDGQIAPLVRAIERAHGIGMEGDRYCDSHCTWADHAPGCPRAEQEGAKQ